MLAGVIFDFDGVIVDSHPLHLETWKEFFRSMGREVADEELAFVLEGAKREEILRHFLGELSDQQIKLYGERKQSMFQQRAGGLKLVQGFAAFLAEVKSAGVPAAVATSGSRQRIEDALALFQLHGCFRVVVTGDDVAEGKPNPALFRLAARGIEVEARDILVCEDAVSGVVAAKAAGMKCLAIATNGRGHKLEEAGSDMVIEDFTRVKLEHVSRLFT
jgi:beta-phosphoglucomutase